MKNSKAVAVVKWFSHSRGFGFLTTPDGDAFFNHRDIDPGTPGYKGLKEGQRVQYEPTTTAKGLAATHVVPVA